MSYLKRKIDSYLIEWKSKPNKHPLIVKGARQVGKTESIRQFAQKEYKNYVEINFVEEPKYKTITEGGFSTESIVKAISRINPSFKFCPHETLIVFDEIQDFPDIVTSLKFFSIDNSYDVICSGSLLGVNYKSITSISVGYKEDVEMQSLDFEEFLWAMGYPENIGDSLLENLKTLKVFSSSEHSVFSSLFIDYCILGGMPAIVNSYIESKNFSGTHSLQKQLISAYKDDIRKYVTGFDQTKILNVFESIPSQLAKENKKFQISKIASGARFKDYWGCIEWLKDAGLINICYCLSFPELPLKGNYDPSKYKIYFKDTGLLVASLDDEAQDDLRANKSLGVYKGALYENFVGEALSKSGYELFYYKREDGTLEQDFFVRTAKELIPIEVKAKNGRSKSLNTLIYSEKYPEVLCGIKLCSGNIGFENNVYTFPYYVSFLIKRFLADK